MTIDWNYKLKLDPLVNSLSKEDAMLLSCTSSQDLGSEKANDAFADEFFETEILPGILEAFNTDPNKEENFEPITRGSLKAVKGTSYPSDVPLREFEDSKKKQKAKKGESACQPS